MSLFAAQTKLFISHSYKDEALKLRVLSLLPKEKKPVVFPPIEVEPHERISDDLVACLNGCDELIYIKGGNSIYSFWVYFEIQYMKRREKQVYWFDSDNLDQLADLPFRQWRLQISRGYRLLHDGIETETGKLKYFDIPCSRNSRPTMMRKTLSTRGDHVARKLSIAGIISVSAAHHH